MPTEQPPRDPLVAPCQWCGYNGENYWQAGTHAPTCRWFAIGGERERRAVLAEPTREAVIDQVRDYLRTTRRAYPSDIADALSLSYEDVLAALLQLDREGVAKPSAPNGWDLKATPPQPSAPIVQPCALCDNPSGCAQLDRCGIVRRLDHWRSLVDQGRPVAADMEIESLRTAIAQQVREAPQPSAVAPESELVQQWRNAVYSPNPIGFQIRKAGDALAQRLATLAVEHAAGQAHLRETILEERDQRKCAEAAEARVTELLAMLRGLADAARGEEPRDDELSDASCLTIVTDTLQRLREREQQLVAERSTLFEAGRNAALDDTGEANFWRFDAAFAASSLGDFGVNVGVFVRETADAWAAYQQQHPPHGDRK